MNRYRVRIRKLNPMLFTFNEYSWHIDFKGDEIAAGITMTYTGALFAASWRVCWYRFKAWIW